MTAKIHNIDSASDAAKPLLENSVKAFGMIPNLHGVLAESAPTLEAYQRLHDLFQQTQFTKEELTVVWQTINVEHECHYCIPAHTAIAYSMKVDPAIVEAIRQGKPLTESKLQTLRETVLELVRLRGKLTQATQQRFFAEGYGNVHLLEIVLGISQKVISNYTNHLFDTPLDAPFQKFA